MLLRGLSLYVAVSATSPVIISYDDPAVETVYLPSVMTAGGGHTF